MLASLRLRPTGENTSRARIRWANLSYAKYTVFKEQSGYSTFRSIFKEASLFLASTKCGAHHSASTTQPTQDKCNKQKKQRDPYILFAHTHATTACLFNFRHHCFFHRILIFRKRLTTSLLSFYFLTPKYSVLNSFHSQKAKQKGPSG